MGREKEHCFVSFFSFRFYLFIFREGEGRRKSERNINVWLPLKYPLLGNLAHSPGMCPDKETNRWPLGLQSSAQSTEPHQPGLFCQLFVHARIDFKKYP